MSKVRRAIAIAVLGIGLAVAGTSAASAGLELPPLDTKKTFHGDGTDRKPIFP